MKIKSFKFLTTALFSVLLLTAFLAVGANAEISPECVGLTSSGFESVLTFDHTGEGLCLSSGSDLTGVSVYSLGSWVAPDRAYISSPTTVTVVFGDSYSMVRYENGNLTASDGTPASGFTRQPARTVTEKTVNAEVTSSGYDIYTPTSNSSSFRYQYGASAIVNPDGSIDVWTSSHGTSASGLWVLDYIAYLHSPDGGETWSDRKIVLSPTAVSADHWSCCDPGVIYFGGYYYLGYTSTLDHKGYANNVFVARSRTPDGPFEKWNGSGWGGDPAPLILYEDYSNHWGSGEVSFVELNGRLYIYYSQREWSNVEGYINRTMVATADASDENWPATVQKWGTAAVRSGNPSGADVKYHETSGKFIMMAMENAATSTSALCVYESSDGLTFTPCDTLYSNVYYYGHNNGMSGSPNGHIVEGDQSFITYAYGTKSSNWATRLAPVTYTLAETADTSDLPANLIKENHGEKSESYTMGITAGNRYYVKHVSDGAFAIPVLTFSNVMGRTAVSDTENIVFTDYDANVVSFVNNVCTPVGAGVTEATVRYAGFYNTVKIIVRPEDVDTSADTLISFVPENDDIIIELGTTFQPQIKGIGISCAGRIGEVFNDSAATSYDLDPATHVVSYSGYDNSLISISDEGIMVPYKTGSTEVTVTCESVDEANSLTATHTFTVKVTVVRPRPYTLTLDPAGGIMSTPEKYHALNGVFFTDILPNGIPTPERAGYAFAGWVNTSTGKTLSLMTRYPSAYDLTYTAQWEATETHTVSFDACGGTDAPDAQTKTIGKTLTVTDRQPTRAGYIFAGWGLTPDSGEAAFLPGSEYLCDADAVLYALWTHVEHDWDEWITDVVPTDLTEGHRYRVCPTCNKKSGEALPRLCYDNPFTDLPEGRWYTVGALYCSAHGILSGTSAGVFSPDSLFTRAMFVMALSRIDGADLSAYTGSRYSDVKAGSWYAAAVEWASESGYAAGVGGGRFAPSSPVTREALAQFLYNYSLKKGLDVFDLASIDGYDDAGSVSGWARTAVRWAVGTGLISGKTASTLVPKGSATRAEVAVIVKNYMLGLSD